MIWPDTDRIPKGQSTKVGLVPMMWRLFQVVIYTSVHAKQGVMNLITRGHEPHHQTHHCHHSMYYYTV